MRKMRKTQTALAALVLVTSICFSSQASAWGSATHAYICDHSGKGERYPLQNLNEIYGRKDKFYCSFKAHSFKITLWLNS